MSVRLVEPTLPSQRFRAEPAPTVFDLGLSENPFPPLPSVLTAVNATLREANRYPEFLPQELPRIIATHLGVSSADVVVGAGATGVALQVMRALGSGELVTSTPTFDGYPIMADMAGMTVVPVPLDPSGNQDLSAMRRAVNRRTALVVLCRPHNPTGTVLEAGAVRKFVAALPQRVPVLLDEAYVEFLAAGDRLDPHMLLVRHPNLLILRTFSKAYGLAGLRIGYCVGRGALIERVRAQQLPFGVATASVAAVRAAYAAGDELNERVDRINREREVLRLSLRACGFDIPESHANFLYVPGPGVATALRRAGIAAKAYADGSARIAVGDPVAGRAVHAALAGLRGGGFMTA
ncbi:aminotransferase class I/II-fold pyridoxal phosphate-dependent enzyme [Nocardia caishijiensis]|uniref:Histidinol-phosphate aminotransferase n=1 Tax=Nocardia caishijiensis TaxID=184756 RepID=A0ABQ6YU69_9NOCA|nr:aminotransferase class I/II-fold pyridoxal phosphate-dependent enzyme [Nocardia caishijiensis]KAF0849347.1 histidinol-phosphate aminotransferase [Nocardia caishijiensis]